MYTDLMAQLSTDYRSVACNGRGYSMTARPADETAYD
jgi:hypothetical protein